MKLMISSIFFPQIETVLFSTGGKENKPPGPRRITVIRVTFKACATKNAALGSG